MRGSCLSDAKLSLQLVKFSLTYAIGIMLGKFWFSFWVFSTRKFGAIILAKFGSGCMHVRPLNYLDALVLYRAHV